MRSRRHAVPTAANFAVRSSNGHLGAVRSSPAVSLIHEPTCHDESACALH